MRIAFLLVLLLTSLPSMMAQVTADAGPDQSTCVNKTFILTGAGLNSGDTGTYQWKDLSNGSVTNSQTIYQNISSSGSRVFELTVTRIHNNITYTDKDSCLIFINGLPAIVLPPPDTVCSGAGIVQLRSNYPTGDPNGIWNGPFVTGSGFDPSLSPKTKQYDDGGHPGKGYKIYFTYTNPVTQCMNKDSLYKMIQSQPEATIKTPNPYQQCEGLPFHMDAVIKWAKGWTWSSSGDGYYSPNKRQLQPDYVHGKLDTMNGTVKMTVTTDKEGVCPQAGDNVTLIIEPYPQFILPPHMVQCEPASINFYSYVFKPNGSPNLRYSWDFGNGQTLTASKNGSPKGVQYPVTKQGWYDVRLTVSNQWGADSSERCSTTKDFEDYVRILPQPTANFKSEPGYSAPVSESSFRFINTSSIAWGPMSYWWNFDKKKSG